MQRVILTFLAVVSLLLGVSASIGSQATPAQAETTIPLYGCPATLDGSPIGGGVGYLNTIDPSQARYVVSTAAELKTALAAATSGQIVYVADGTTCLLTTSTIYSATTFVRVPAGVILAGGRGRATPGIIRVDASLMAYVYKTCISTGTGARVTGLNIWGPDETTAKTNHFNGVVAGDNVEVDNCEIHGFGTSGVYAASASGVRVHHNYIHHCQTAGEGYGVQTVGTSGLVVPIYEGNIFDWNRHHHSSAAGTAANGRYAAFEFRYNQLGANCTNTQLDVHGQETAGAGPAGDTWSFHHNTSICTNQPFVGIRGIPVTLGKVYNNWTYTTETQEWTLYSDRPKVRTINQQMSQIAGYGYQAPSGGPWVKMEVEDNWFGTTPPPSTNVAPVLNTIGNKSIEEGATLSFTISGSDANGDALTYSASNLPVGATFNSTNRTFSWTPGLGQAGVYAGVHFQVSDGQVTDYEDITITVTVIDEVAPVLNAIGDKSINWGATLSFTISGSDANGDALTYSASNLPVGATFDPATQTFSWTPEDSQAGVYASIRFQVSDGSLSDTEDITITVSGGVLADVNSDGAVNSLDMIMVGQHWNETGESGWIPEDINKDGTVNVLDATLVGQHWTG